MVFKNEHRLKISKILFVSTISLIVSLFIEGVFKFERYDIGLSLIFLCICGIIICSLYEEFHIKEDAFTIKCFYYKHKIGLKSIKKVAYTRSKIYLYGENNVILYTLFRDDSEKVKYITDILNNQDIPKIKISFNLL